MKKSVAVFFARAASCLLACVTVLLCAGCTVDKPVEPDPTAEPTVEPTPAVTYKPLTDYLSEMSASPFTVEGTVAETLGVEDSADVGIRLDKFENEVLYPVPADEDCAHIYNVADYGVTPENRTDNGAKLNALLKSLKNVEGVKKVVFPVGVYPLECTFSIDGVKDVYICSSDPAENFEFRMIKWCQAINCNNCTNIHFNNYNLDYETSPTVGGVIDSFTMSGTVVLKIDDEFDLTRPEYNGGSFNHNHSYIEFEYDEAQGCYVPVNNMLYNGDVRFSSYDAENKLLTLSLSSLGMKNCKIGGRVSVAFTMYEYFGFHGVNNDGLYFEHVNIYTCGGMAFGNQTNTLYMNHVRLDLREGSTRLMTATADGLHCTDCPSVTVTNSVFQYSHDDSMNIKSWYKDVTGAEGKNLTLYSSSANFEMNVGDELEIYEKTYFERKAECKIVRIIAHDARTYTLVVDVDLPEGLEGCICANTSRGTRLHIADTLFGNKRNRGILVQCRESVIEHCTFRNIAHGCLCIYTIRDSCCEGICPKDITVRNSKFIRTNIATLYNYGTSGIGTVGTLRNMQFYDNFCTQSHSPITIAWAADCVARNNLFYNVGVGADTAAGCCAVSVSQSVRTTVTDNTVYADKYDSHFRTVYDASAEGTDIHGNFYKGLDNGKTRKQ